MSYKIRIWKRPNHYIRNSIYRPCLFCYVNMAHVSIVLFWNNAAQVFENIGGKFNLRNSEIWIWYLQINLFDFSPARAVLVVVGY